MAELDQERKSHAGARTEIRQLETIRNGMGAAIIKACDKLGVPPGPMKDRLELVAATARQQSMDTAGDAVRKVVAIFLSHYPDLDRVLLGQGWCPGYTNEQYDSIEEGAIDFAKAMLGHALHDLGL